MYSEKHFVNEIKLMLQSNFLGFVGLGPLHPFRSSAGVLSSLFRDQFFFPGAMVTLPWSLGFAAKFVLAQKVEIIGGEIT